MGNSSDTVTDFSNLQKGDFLFDDDPNKYEVLKVVGMTALCTVLFSFYYNKEIILQITPNDGLAELLQRGYVDIMPISGTEALTRLLEMEAELLAEIDKVNSEPRGTSGQLSQENKEYMLHIRQSLTNIKGELGGE